MPTNALPEIGRASYNTRMDIEKATRMTRYTTMAALGLALTACACDRQKTATPRAPEATTQTTTMSSMHFDATAGRQVAALRYSRPGEWIPVMLRAQDSRVQAGLAAKDRFGARLMVARPTGGYDVHLIETDCTRHLISDQSVRGTANDTRPIGTDSTEKKGAVEVVVMPDDVKRICDGGPQIASGTPAQVASRLHDANTKAVTPPPAPEAATRAKAWAEYQAKNGRK